MYQQILLPTEASPESAPVVDLALDLADRWEASLCVLYVPEDGSIVDIPAEDRRGQLSAERDVAIEEIEDTVDRSDVPVETRVGTGKPEHSIPRHVDRVGADFVVIGTHGRTGVERLIVGSVAEEVLREVDVPVLVVPLADDA